MARTACNVIGAAIGALLIALALHPAWAQPTRTTTVAATGPKVRVLIAGNTNVGGIGDGIRNNIERLEGILRTFGAAGLTPQVTKLVASDFTCAKLDTALVALRRSAAQNDTIIFYFAGHGFRNEQTASIFPNLLCDEFQARNLETVVRQLKQRVRLVIGIADSCNKFLPIQSRPVSPLQLPPLPGQDARIRHLMLDYRGILIMSAAKPNQFAYYAATRLNPVVMGHFSRQLFAVLSGAIDRDTPKATWAEIVQPSIKKLDIKNDNLVVVDTQQPQALNELRRLPGR